MTEAILAHLQRMTPNEASITLDGTIDALEYHGNRLEQHHGRDRADRTIAACLYAQQAIRERTDLLTAATRLAEATTRDSLLEAQAALLAAVNACTPQPAAPQPLAPPCVATPLPGDPHIAATSGTDFTLPLTATATTAHVACGPITATTPTAALAQD